jgi:hypothetical protein
MINIDQGTSSDDGGERSAGVRYIEKQVHFWHLCRPISKKSLPTTPLRTFDDAFAPPHADGGSRLLLLSSLFMNGCDILHPRARDELRYDDDTANEELAPIIWVIVLSL